MNRANQQLKVLLVLSLLLSLSQAKLEADPLGSPDERYNFGGRNIIRGLESEERSVKDHRYELRKDKDLDPSAIHADSNDKKSSPDRNDPFDGSEFNASTFTDTDFSKHNYQDLFSFSTSPGDASVPPNRAEIKGMNTDLSGFFSVERNRIKHEEIDKESYKKLVKPVYFQVGDWVPSSLDSTWNGGFTTPPDNGSPVPYRLNGHVNEQRKLPWED